jgi:hypothetical protein
MTRNLNNVSIGLALPHALSFEIRDIYMSALVQFNISCSIKIKEAQMPPAIRHLNPGIKTYRS